MVPISGPDSDCGVYGKCGAFASCYFLISSTVCKGLRGVEPYNMEEWNRGNWTCGYVRRTQLQCERVKSSSGDH